MTMGENHSSGSGRREDVRLSTAALLRAAADGELTAAEQSHLDQHLAANPGDAARIGFERDLRGLCARSMAGADGTAGAPAGLRAAIEARLAQCREQDATLADPVAGRIHEGGRVQTRAGAPAAWRARRVMGLISLAAAIPIVAAGWLILAGRTAGTGGQGTPDGVITAATPLVSYLSREHCDCEATNGKVKPVAPVPAATQSSREQLRQLVGQRISIEDVERAGFTYLGEGPSDVPGAGASLHYLFMRHRPARDGKPARDVRLSLFIQKADSTRFTEGIAWATQSGLKSKPYILAWENDGVAYYLVTECSASRDLARQQFGAPDTTGSL